MIMPIQTQKLILAISTQNISNNPTCTTTRIAITDQGRSDLIIFHLKCKMTMNGNADSEIRMITSIAG